MGGPILLLKEGILATYEHMHYNKDAHIPLGIVAPMRHISYICDDKMNIIYVDI
jgi:hypothetical protein